MSANSIQTIEKIRNEQSSALFFNSILHKAKSHHQISKPVLIRKYKRPHYLKLQFVEGYESSQDYTEPLTVKDQF